MSSADHHVRPSMLSSNFVHNRIKKTFDHTINQITELLLNDFTLHQPNQMYANHQLNIEHIAFGNLLLEKRLVGRFDV